MKKENEWQILQEFLAHAYPDFEFDKDIIIKVDEENRNEKAIDFCIEKLNIAVEIKMLDMFHPSKNPDRKQQNAQNNADKLNNQLKEFDLKNISDNYIVYIPDIPQSKLSTYKKISKMVNLILESIRNNQSEVEISGLGKFKIKKPGDKIGNKHLGFHNIPLHLFQNKKVCFKDDLMETPIMLDQNVDRFLIEANKKFNNHNPKYKNILLLDIWGFTRLMNSELIRKIDNIEIKNKYSEIDEIWLKCCDNSFCQVY